MCFSLVLTDFINILYNWCCFCISAFSFFAFPSPLSLTSCSSSYHLSSDSWTFPFLYPLTQHKFSTEPSLTLFCFLCHYCIHSVFLAINFKMVAPNWTLSKGPGLNLNNNDLLKFSIPNLQSPTHTCILAQIIFCFSSSFIASPMMPPALQWSRYHHPKYLGVPLENSCPPHLVHALSFIFVHPALKLCLKSIFSFLYLLPLLYSLLFVIGFHSKPKLLYLLYLCQNDHVASLIFVILYCLLFKSECLFVAHKAFSDLIHTALGLLGGSDSKESSCSAGDLGLIPRAEWSPGEGNGHPLQ